MRGGGRSRNCQRYVQAIVVTPLSECLSARCQGVFDVTGLKTSTMNASNPGKTDVLLDSPPKEKPGDLESSSTSAQNPPNEGPPRSGVRVSVCSFSSLRPMKQLFVRQRHLPKTCVFPLE